MFREGASPAASVLSSRAVLEYQTLRPGVSRKKTEFPAWAGGAVPPPRALSFPKAKCSERPWLPFLPVLFQLVRRGKFLPAGHAVQQIFPILPRRRFVMFEGGE